MESFETAGAAAAPTPSGDAAPAPPPAAPGTAAPAPSPATPAPASAPPSGVAAFAAVRLSAAQRDAWRDFADAAPHASYAQDPDWADVERDPAHGQAREPRFFWAERDGRLCLTALGVRRRLPVPGRVFWEFEGGPVVSEPAVLDDWLTWLTKALGHESGRLRLQPAWALDEAGDQMESILDAHGFLRRRSAGIWTTLTVGIERSDDELLASFRRQTRQKIKQSDGLGLRVAAEDDERGWAALVALDAEMAARTPVRPIERGVVAAISRHWLRGGAGGTVLVARRDGEPLAAALLIVSRSTAHLHTLPSSRRSKELPAAHLLVWEAMRWAREQGCALFDLDGYAVTARQGEPLWGVNQFKRGFAPKLEIVRTVAVHERVFSPTLVSSAALVRELQATYRRFRGAAGS